MNHHFQEQVFKYAVDQEEPLTLIEDMLVSVSKMAELQGGEIGNATMRLCWIAREALREAVTWREALFDLSKRGEGPAMEIISAPYDRDAVISELTDLQELLGASLEAFGEVSFGHGDTRNHHLDRIFSFTRIAFEWTQGIERKLSSSKWNTIETPIEQKLKQGAGLRDPDVFAGEALT